MFVVNIANDSAGQWLANGWQEPAQTPEFDECTGCCEERVETRTLGMEVRAGQAIFAPKGEWVQYSTPG